MLLCLLYEEELEIVEKGKRGMRDLTNDEKKLLEKSKRRMAKKLLIGANDIWLTSKAQKKAKKDPTITLRIAEKAYQLDKNKNVTQAIHKIYRENIFYKIFTRQEASISAAAISSDGRYILIGFKDGTTRLLDTEGNEIQVFKGHKMPVNSVAFSPDNRYILTGSKDGIIRIWDRKVKELQLLNVRKKGGRKKSVTSITFSPDSKLVLTGSTDKIPRLGDLQGRELQVFKGHKRVYSVAFSPDSKYILTGAKDGTASLWDLQGKKIQVFKGHKRRGHERGVTSVTFSPDSKFILTGSKDKTAREWEIKIPLEEFLKSGYCEPLSKEQKWEYGIEKPGQK